ncbi:unnamed protein product [Ceutorhynchus assimilis]|uniref:Uncharacterized protein n=1 Tax=Ceutorhynchus assimilis TaxID=467358 RepID=A0A9N9MNU0_9CUCU|nr:unnamed protein product [Ceutorhynchus assimilis]
MFLFLFLAAIFVPKWFNYYACLNEYFSIKMSTKKCVGKETFQRINYLYQLCNKLTTENRAAHIASNHYSNLAVNISKKAVQRLDIDIKRTLCKGCRSILIPGVTCKIRIKKKKVLKHCMKCSRVKVFDTRNKNYVPWSHREESLVELLDYADEESESKKNKMDTSGK